MSTPDPQPSRIQLSARAKDVAEEETVPVCKTPRKPFAADLGTFAKLSRMLTDEQKGRYIGADLGSEDNMFDVPRETLQKQHPHQSETEVKEEMDEDSY